MLNLYHDIVDWYPLVDPLEDHADESAVFAELICAALVEPPSTLLELGCGAGNNAWYLKRHFACTLTDLSPAMLALSRTHNPDCEHHCGDMRSLRLNRQFDAVFVHDAIVYMTTEADLRAAIETAFFHTRPGGVALLAPDYVTETFRESAEILSADKEGRSLRGLEWAWDLDPADTQYQVEYSFLLRESGTVRSLHDSHTEGLFPRATWCRLLENAGFSVSVHPIPLDGYDQYEAFVCIKEGSSERRSSVDQGRLLD